MANDFTIFKTALESDKFRKACVNELHLAVGAQLYGRVEAIALLLVLLEDDTKTDLDKIGIMLSDHVFYIIGGKIAADVVNSEV